MDCKTEQRRIEYRTLTALALLFATIFAQLPCPAGTLLADRTLIAQDSAWPQDDDGADGGSGAPLPSPARSLPTFPQPVTGDQNQQDDDWPDSDLPVPSGRQTPASRPGELRADQGTLDNPQGSGITEAETAALQTAAPAVSPEQEKMNALAQKLHQPRECILPPAAEKGVLFNCQITHPLYKAAAKNFKRKQAAVDAAEIAAAKNAFNVEELPSLKAIAPKMGTDPAAKNPILTGGVEESAKMSRAQLKAQRAKEGKAGKERRLLAKAIMDYGTPGLFVVSSVIGPWGIKYALKGGAAEAAGLRSGDIILSIDNQSTVGMPAKDIHFLLIGHRGQQKVFKIQRRGQNRSYVVTLYSIYDMKDPLSQYIEYYWYLLYNNLVSTSRYNQLMNPVLRAYESR